MLVSVGHEGASLVLEALHPEPSIAAAAIDEPADGEPIDQLAARVELGDIGVDLSGIERAARAFKSWYPPFAGR